MGHTSYLYGTFHGRDARLFRFQDSVLVALNASDLVAGELEVSAARKLDNTVTNAMLLPNGGSLDKLYSRRDYNRVIGALKERLGPLAPLCTKLRPFYIVAMLSQMELGNDSAMVLDAWFQERALQAGKSVMGLETISEQLSAIERIPLREQAKLLYAVIDRDQDKSTDLAVNAYLARDLDALMALLERDGLPEHADKALLDERNARMVDRLQKQMEKGHRVFAAVGAAHLPGPDGILALFRMRGYEVKPIAADTAAAVPQWNSPIPRAQPATAPPSIFLKHGIHFRNDTLGFAVDMPAAPTRRILCDGDSLRMVSWAAHGSPAERSITVTTSEGSSVREVDPRTRIERCRALEPVDLKDAEIRTRIDGFQAYTSIIVTLDGRSYRRITVATPLRTHWFDVPLDKRKQEDFLDRVTRSIRILEPGAERSE